MKRPDPHEEALTILRGQMSHAAAAPGTQVRGRVWLGPGGTKDKVGPLGEPQKPAGPCKLWPCCSPLSTVFGAGTGPQRGRSPGEAGDQHTKAIRGAHSR